jgi:alpha-glucosidase (family GH31 glycosyl hydrolase)
MPLETIWVDSSFAMAGANFQVDTAKYPDLSAFRTTLEATKQKLVVSFNTGLDATKLGDQYIIDGQEGAAFIKSTLFTDGDYQGALVTAANAEQTVFLDLFQGAAGDLWGAGLTDLYTQTMFDGISFVGNEPSSKCNGECQDGVPVPPEPSTKQSRKLSEEFLSTLEEDSGLWYTSYADQSEVSTYNLPFIPYNSTVNLDNATLSLNATHVNDVTEYDAHSLMGKMQSDATRAFLSEVSPAMGNRPFIMSASTYSGSGQSAGHSLGPNERTWDNMKNLTAGVMNMNMFGVPFAGPDVCGTFGEADEELCARWIQTSAFYPFAR